MDERKIALFDMDGTLADYDGQLRRDLERLRGPDEAELPEDLREFISKNRFLQNRRWAINQVGGWWLNLPRLEWGFEILSMAQEIGFKIHILTKGPRRSANAWSEKLLWCQKHIHADIDVTITQDKGMVYGRVLVDDSPDYMTRWLAWRPRGLGIMPLTGSGRAFNHDNVIKYDRTDESTIEVRRRLQAAFDRPITREAESD